MTWLTVLPQISLWYYGTVVLEIFCGAHRKGRGTKKKSPKQFFSFRVEFYDTCSRPIALPHRKPAKALCSDARPGRSGSRWRPRQRLLAAARQQALGLAEMRTVVGRCRARPSAGGAGAPVRNTCDVPGTGDGRWMHTGFRQGAGSAALTVPRSAAGACHRHVGSHVDLHKSDCADEGDRSLLALLVPVFVLRPPLLSCVQLALLSVLILALAFSWQGDPTPSAGSTVEPAALRIQWTGSGRWGAGCGVRVCARAQSLCLPLLLPPPFPVRSLTCTLSHSLLLIPLFSLFPPPPHPLSCLPYLGFRV